MNLRAPVLHSHLRRVHLWGWLLAGIALLVQRSAAAPISLIPTGSTWRYRPGTNEASQPDPAQWRELAFPDTSWAAGPLPVYYGEPLTGTLITGMQNGFTTLFLRRHFTVENPNAIETARLTGTCDDGFMAWINGELVASYNVDDSVVASPSFSSVAISAANEPVGPQEYPVNNPRQILHAGENVLAVMVFNVNLTSSDIVFDAGLEATVDDTPPTLLSRTPPPGAFVRDLVQVELDFSEPVQGVDAGDLLVNGVPATDLTFLSPSQFLFTVPRAPAGKATLSLRSNHGITDLASPPHPFAADSWTVTVDPNLKTGTLEITEFLANNNQGLRDDDGDRSDWVEIHNPTSESVSLVGWHLTDSSTNQTRWSFPLLALPANSYLLVWCSGKNRTNPAAPLHTDFKLAKEGQYLALVSPGGEAVSEFAPQYPAQRADVSYGRVTGGGGLLGYFPNPTPRSANSTSGPGFAPDVVFSESGRSYQGALNVALSLSTNEPPVDGAVIRYTLDNSVPTESSPLYTAPFRFNNQVVRVRAAAFAPRLFPGQPRTEVYVPLTTAVAAFRSDLPVLLIHNFNQGTPGGSWQQAVIQEYRPNTNGVTLLTNAPHQSARAVIKSRGSSTGGLPKVSLRVEFQDEFGRDLDVGLLGMPADADWVLYAPNYFEPVLTHNPFMHQLSRDIGRYSPRTRFCEVYLVTQGLGGVDQASYNGIYVLEERIEIGADRVDAGKLAPENLQLPALSGGYLLKRDRLDPGDSGLFAGGESLGFVDPSETELELPARRVQYNYIKGYLDEFGNALSRSDFTNPLTGYRKYIEVGSWIDHHLLNVLALNVDALRLSAYLYKPRNGRLSFGPLWDFDRTLGSTDGRDADPRVWRSTVSDLGTDFFGFATQAWWGRLFQDPDFFQEWIDRYQTLRSAQFSTTNLWRLQDELSAQVRNAQPRERQKWGVSPRDGSYAGEVAFTKRWISNRVEFMDGQLVRRPQFNTELRRVTNGFTVELSLPAKTLNPGAYTLYYTTDGTDPRLPGGAISTRARAYSGPIPLTQNSRIVARSRNPTPVQSSGGSNPPLKSNWSGPLVDTFVVDPLPLVVSEIHYHPIAPGAPRASDFEFVELLNRGSNTVSLTGYHLRGGIDFTFTATNAVRELAPGGRVLLARQLASFLSRYPGTAARIAGEYTGALSNGGNRLALFGPLEESGFDFSYQDTWVPATDGAGYSLVLRDETIDVENLALAASWRASARIHGSPGLPDEATLSFGLGLELVGHDDAALRIRFSAASGQTYVVEATGALANPGWEVVVPVPAGAARSVEAMVPFSGPARFVRVRGL